MQELNAKDLKSYSPDLIIDARSPREFLESHIKNAQNFYALSDKEHKIIGTIYKRQSKTHAKALGASYICKNMSEHILELEKSLKIGSKIAIYCARGGQRSSSVGMILSQIGYRVAKIKDGYKGYRNFVLDFLDDFSGYNFITLHGNTGSGKTELIKSLTPSIDLEGLANHFGSTFGSVKGEQPSTKSFQNNLAHELLNLPKNQYCFIEGESKKIGSVVLPSKLYEKMQEGVKVWIQTPMEQRVGQILKDYENIDDEFFYYCMDKISPYIKKTAKEQIINSYKTQDLEQVAFLLLSEYYDKTYKKPKSVDFAINFTNKDKTIENLNKIAKELNEQKIL